ncbi:MAG: Ldh family oxidoreductase, partial [Gemmatimonadetes bacterium]|nr:Ldh family oxidoreductase [Gemmatimonadota bacterium]
MTSIPMRNTPPDHGIKVPYETHLAFIKELFVSAGMDGDEAGLMGRILATADKRCIYSHGTHQALGYLPKLRDGDVNPRPNVTTVRESETVLVLDGDGGMGYGPSHRGMETAIEKALAHGLGAAATRNHYHFGAAGNYSRMALEHGCVGWALSTHRVALDPDNVIMSASGGSPMSLAFPTRNQPPLVLDMAAVFMRYKDELFQEHFALFAKSLGLAVALQALGGILAGIWRSEFQPPNSKWESNQGAFLLAMKIDHFMDLDEFEQTLD